MTTYILLYVEKSSEILSECVAVLIELYHVYENNVARMGLRNRSNLFIHDQANSQSENLKGKPLSPTKAHDYTDLNTQFKIGLWADIDRNCNTFLETWLYSTCSQQDHSKPGLHQQSFTHLQNILISNRQIQQLTTSNISKMEY